MIANATLVSLAERFHAEGFCVVENLVDPSMISSVLDAASTMASARDGTFSPIPMPHRVHPQFLAMMRYAPVVEIVERLVGGEAAGIGGEFFFSRPGVPGFVRHQDNAYVQAPPEAFVSAWTALCDIDEMNGCLAFYPGSHKLGTLPIRELNSTPVVGQNPGAEALEAVMPEGMGRVTVPLSEGATVFFHGDVVHESLANRSSDRFRHAFLATYIRRGAPFRPGRIQQRTEVLLH
jgi:ectoine hydroxylase-related dioxygenase (phytanoyl-CoA dioxygenase family)